MPFGPLKKWYGRLVALAALLIALWFVSYKASHPVSGIPQSGLWPSPEELDSMVRYTTRIPPSEQLPVRSVGSGLPSGNPFDQPRVASAPTYSSSSRPPRAPKRPWNLTAILITDNRKAAVINEILLSVGDQVREAYGGSSSARVVSIERDRVIITEPNGKTHTLNIAGGGRL